MEFKSFISKTLSIAALSIGVFSALTGCASSKNAEKSSETRLPKIDMGAWRYNESDNVYYKLGIQYVSNPADEKYENLGIFVPGSYFDGRENGDGTYTVTVNKSKKAGGFTSDTAPFVMPIQTPGYSACDAPADYVGQVKEYTDAGLIFVYAGARGRDHGLPAGVTDFKAAIRYVRHNKSVLPGDTDRFFTFGMSGG